MTLPASGSIAADLINTELGVPATTQLSMADLTARDLAGVPSGSVQFTDFYGKTATPPPAVIPTYVGLLPYAIATVGELQSLTVVNLVLPYRFTLNAPVGQYMYFAAPTTYGYIKFYDTESQFTGGWDGANNNWSIFGPRDVPIDGVMYYVYRTDFSGLGLSIWEARYDANPSY